MICHMSQLCKLTSYILTEDDIHTYVALEKFLNSSAGKLNKTLQCLNAW